MRKTAIFFLSILLCLSSWAVQAEEQAEKKQVRVYVDIVGDLFHAVHVEFLKKARSLGDYLIVGVHTDDVVEGYKRRPILSLEERVKVVEACKYVDEVVIGAPIGPSEAFLKEHQIDCVVHGDDFNKDMLHLQYGDALKLGIFRSVPYTPGISSTQIIQRIVDRYEEGEFHRH
jgi:cytidyltransferase-like protein